MQKTWFTFLIILSLVMQFTHANSIAQSGVGSSTGHPIEIQEHQKKFVANGTVVIKGVTIAPQTGEDRLTVKIFAPDGTQDVRFVSPDKDGNFRITVPNVSQLGHYRMVIYGYRDANNQTVEYDIVAPFKQTAEVKIRVESIGRSTREIVDGARRALLARRQTAEIEEKVRQLELIADKVNKLNDLNGKAVASLDRLTTLITSEPRLAAAAEGLNELGRWETETQDLDERLKASAAKMRNMPTSCDSLETAGEGFTLLSTVKNFIGSPTAILKNLMVDKVLPAVNNMRTDVSETTRFEATEIGKEILATAEGIPSLLASIFELSADIAQFFTGKLFSNYCSVLEGTIVSDFAVDQKQKGVSWWRYRVVLKGKFKLWAEKDQPEGPEGVVYTGRIEGNTTRLEFFEDVFVIENPGNGKILLRKRIMPIVVGNTANDPLGFGQVARMATPGHFNIRYKGALKDDKMALHQESVGDDFSSLYANRLILVISPQGGLIPTFKTFTFPIQKAAWMIDRTTKGDFVLPVTYESTRMVLKKTFIRDETLSDGASKVTFRVDYDLSGDNKPVN